MGNRITNENTIIINEEENIKTHIICPKCPLIPLINIISTKEGTLICEYRCPSFHLGLVKLDEMIFNPNKKDKKYETKCKNCHKDISELGKKFCGICKIFLCKSCVVEHNKLKPNHKIIEKSEINNSCLEHGNKIKFYCFNCLKSICTKCLGHNNHCFKDLKDIEPNEEFIENLNFYFKEVYNYFHSIEKTKLDDFNKKIFYF